MEQEQLNQEGREAEKLSFSRELREPREVSDAPTKKIKKRTKPAKKPPKISEDEVAKAKAEKSAKANPKIKGLVEAVTGLTAVYELTAEKTGISVADLHKFVGGVLSEI